MREIGGCYEFPFSTLLKPRTNRFPQILATGRDCLTLITRFLKEGTILLPAYICEAVLTPFKVSEFKIKFYDVNERLEVKKEVIAKELKNAKALLIIDYFGFPQKDGNDIHKLCNKKGVLLLEDRVHSWLSKFDSYGDISFNSFRKMLPVPDGATIEGITPSQLEKPPSKFVRFMLLSLMFRRFFKQKSQDLYRKAEYEEIERYKKPARGSRISKFVLERIDLSKVIKIRKENFTYLLNNWKGINGITPLYKTLPDYVCPLGFPVLCRHRDNLKQHLIRHKIYPPIHWILSKDIPKRFKVAHKISNELLTIPIDQRYTQHDMERVLKIIKNVSKTK